MGDPVDIPRLADFARPGIYFLYDAGAVVYVGQAVNVRRRIGDHISEGVKVFDACSFEPCPVEKLAARERRYIAKLTPKYNQCMVAVKARRKEAVFAAHTYLSEVEAAAFLDMTVEELTSLGDIGPVSKLVRVRKQRGRVRLYLPADLRDFAADRHGMLGRHSG